jgi:hypothetical protein
MPRHSDRNTSEAVSRMNEQTLVHADTASLHRLLMTELLLLERDSGAGQDWRIRQQRVKWCQQLAAEIRRRGEQQSLFG